MQFIATLAVVASVLVLAYQARELAGHTRISNEVAGTEAHRECVFHWNRVIAPVFLQHPELYAYYFDQTTNTPNASDSVRLKILADQYASWLEVGIITSEQLRSYARDIGDWPGYATALLASSTPLRAIVRDNPGLYPPLEPLLATYDASHDGG
jgi:hypothetical protein